MGDRSFLTEILAVLLAATIAWPSSLLLRTGPAASSSIAPIAASASGHPLIRARNQNFKSLPERYQSKLRSILDDDPAMFSDESEDWIEDSGGLLAVYASIPAHRSFFMAALVLGMNACSQPAATSPFSVLCRYQC